MPHALCLVYLLAGASLAAESFEGAATPPGWTTEGAASLAVSPDHAKAGTRSLAWQWRAPGAALRYRSDGLGKLTRQHSFGFWLRCEQPLHSVLRLELTSGNQVVGRCWYVLNYRGWRPLGAPYAQLLSDLKQPVDGMRLLAPEGMPAGVLWLDWIEPRCADRLFADDQQPWVGRPELLAAPPAFRDSRDVSVGRSWLPALSQPTARELADLDKLAQRLGPYPCPIAADANALDEAAALLTRPLTGRTGRWSDWGFNEPTGGVSLVDCGKLLTRLAGAWLDLRRRGKPDDRYAQAALKVCDHLLEQGVAEGNLNTSFGLDTRGILALREPLAASGRLRELLLALSQHGDDYEAGVLLGEDPCRPPQIGLGGNCDMLWANLAYSKALRPLLLLPDPAERLQRVRCWRRALELMADPRRGEPFALDGTTHHHAMYHMAYGGGAIDRTLRFAVVPTADTVFRFSPEFLTTLKRAVLTCATLCNRDIAAPNVPGYTGGPFGRREVLLPWFDLLARCGTPDGTRPLDPELAGLFLKLNDDPRHPSAVEFRAAGVAPYNFDGHLTLNGAASACHRRADWSVVLAGMFKFRRGKEINGAYVGSCYARWARHGSIWVTGAGQPVSPWASGYRLDGWDARFFPGATALLTDAEGAIGPGGHGSRSAFGGGTSLDGDGIWGVELVAEDRALSFRKSAFCFGDRITVVTTDIAHGGAPAERHLPFTTTLFQNAFGVGGSREGHFGVGTPPVNRDVPPADEPCWVNGREVREFPCETQLPAGQTGWLLDNKGTGFYLHANPAPVRLARREQRWTFRHNAFFRLDPAKGDAPDNYPETRGNFALAWLDHGVTPAPTACVYTLLPRTSPATMAALAAAMSRPETAPYQVLRADAKAHVFVDRPSRTTCYVIFDPAARFDSGPLQAVNRPCWVMVREGDGLMLSVASTDLDSWQVGYPVAASGDLVLTLAGRAALKLPLRDYMPMRLTAG